MTTTDTLPSGGARTVTRPRRSALSRWWRRRPVNRALVLAHRWPGLVLGLLLVIECTSGAILLYNAELFRATNGDLYHHTASADPITAEQALATVAQAHPGFGATWVAADHGVFAVGNQNYANLWFVDPGTGHLNGVGNLDRGFLGLLVNLHDCAFACEGLPGYNSWFAAPLWSGGPSFLTGITRGGFALGVLGLVMILLVLTSLKIWWPGLRRLRSRFTVRRGKGRFARDFDLHNVVGAVALPFLLMWGITGAALEFPGIEKGWVALTGGNTATVDTAFYLKPHAVAPHTPRITTEQAVAAALEAVPGRATWIGLPTKGFDDYEIDVVSSYASDAHRAVYSGDTYVLIDPYDASHLKIIDGGDEAAGNRFYDKFLEPTHFGWNVNGWWRILWFAFGVAPLVLMVTGVSTWLWRRGVRKRRRAAAGASGGGAAGTTT